MAQLQLQLIYNQIHSIIHQPSVRFLLKKHCNILFPEHRTFMNYKQLSQYVDLFARSWSVKKYREAFEYYCHYGEKNDAITTKNAMI